MRQDKDVVDLLIIKVSGRDCALPLTHLQEVVPLAELLRPPGAPLAIEGFLNLAGVMLPVVRLDRVLGLPEFTVDIYSPILVLKNVARPLAFLAQAAVRVVNLPAKELHAIDACETLNGCVRAEFVWNDVSIALLEPEKILGLEEERAIRDFADLAGQKTAAAAPGRLA